MCFIQTQPEKSAKQNAQALGGQRTKCRTPPHNNVTQYYTKGELDLMGKYINDNIHR